MRGQKSPGGGGQTATPVEESQLLFIVLSLRKILYLIFS